MSWGCWGAAGEAEAARSGAGAGGEKEMTCRACCQYVLFIPAALPMV